MMFKVHSTFIGVGGGENYEIIFNASRAVVLVKNYNTIIARKLC